MRWKWTLVWKCGKTLGATHWGLPLEKKEPVGRLLWYLILLVLLYIQDFCDEF